MEHRQIKELLEKIHDEIAKKNIKIEEFESRLIEVLTAHNDKEESILYPWIDDSISEKEEAFEKMENLPAERYNKCCE